MEKGDIRKEEPGRSFGMEGLPAANMMLISIKDGALVVGVMGAGCLLISLVDAVRRTHL
jgi:hypothetical protein